MRRIMASVAVAIALVSHALETATGLPVILDVPDAQSELREWLVARGFRVQRPFIRMVRGEPSVIGKPEQQFAIAGPELG